LFYKIIKSLKDLTVRKISTGIEMT